MQKRLKIFLVAPAVFCALPLLWFACTAPQTASGPKVAASPVSAPAPLDAGFHSTVRPFVQTYCVGCHGGAKPKAELDLSSYTTLASVTKDVRRWNEVMERVKAGEMPPDDAEKIPTEAERRPVVDWLQTMHTAEVRRTAGDPGYVLARRLSNSEYDYTIRDLTGVDLKPTREFPVDPANTAGFDNSGESLAMSPALVQKYLDAARAVADCVVFAPDGLRFAPYPVTTDEDRDKYGVNQIVDFYRRQGRSIGIRYDQMLGQVLDYADYFAAAWRFEHRADLARSSATIADFAHEAGISSKYLSTIVSLLNTPAGDLGPTAALQARWKKLPAPAAGREPATLAAACEAMRDFVNETRGLVRMTFSNLVTNDRIVAAGSQAFVLWKDRQYAESRTTYSGKALELDWKKFTATDPAMIAPSDEAGRARFDESFKGFCAVFPDAFYVAERARMFHDPVRNLRDIESDLRGHRLLTAGLHSQMAFFRDDKPLYDLVLDDAQRRELDGLWRELEFTSEVPFRQFKQNVWFERGEPPSLMVNPIFNEFRSEDDNLISAPMVKKLADTYYDYVSKMVLHVRAPGQGRAAGGDNTPLNFRAPAPGSVNGPPPSGFIEQRLSPEALQAIRDYFAAMNTRIRALEQAQKAAEPLQLKSLADFAERAYRRPLTQAERDDILAFYRQLREEGLGHEDAIRDSIVSTLMSPAFVCRVDLPNATKGGDVAGVEALSDFELANRLSYFLWSSMPDPELLRHAAAGDLHRPEVVAAQALRMLRDPKVRGFATEFGGNWLDIRRFEEHNAVDRERFPEFTNELRSAMFEEPIRYIVDLVQRNGSILDFVYGDYTFVNGPLAKHYGMPGPTSPDEWVRIDNASKYHRGGLLPMAGFLTKNAPGLRTSPVKRGYWVVTKLLGERIPPPPPNVPVLPSDETKLGDLTLRQTLAKHRQDKSCASCHNKFDSFGLVFEGFGPVGEVRTTDLAGRPTETTAVFPDGSEGDGVSGLQRYFRAKVQGEFIDNFCRKLLVFALGRSLIPSDDLIVASMRQKLAADGYRFDDLINEIVTSRQFLNKRVASDPATTASL